MSLADVPPCTSSADTICSALCSLMGETEDISSSFLFLSLKLG